MEHDPNTPSRVRAQFNQAESDKIINQKRTSGIQYWVRSRETGGSVTLSHAYQLKG